MEASLLTPLPTRKQRKKETKLRMTPLVKKYLSEYPEATEEEIRAYKLVYEKKVRYICSYAKKHEQQYFKRRIIDDLPVDLNELKDVSVSEAFRKLSEGQED